MIVTSLGINHIIILVICLLLLVSCYTDLRYRIISNYVVIAIFLLAVLNALFGEGTFNFISAAIFLLCGLILFYCRLIGGGDVKLITVLLLLLPSSCVILFLVSTTIVGLPLAVIALIYKWVTQKQQVTLPYAIAISSGYFFTLIMIL